MNRPKPNTGIPGNTLVVPDVDACPLCGQWWVQDIGQTRWDTRGARPEALDMLDGSDYVMHSTLVWVCTRCGHRHMHGVQP